jgi:double-stranded uracil-DNA glycosylase
MRMGPHSHPAVVAPGPDFGRVREHEPMPDGWAYERDRARRMPRREELERAAGRTIPDVVAADLRVLFCGINPSLTSGATGWHFAHPGNRFWRALYAGGWTARQLHPSEQRELLSDGLGLTNLVRRATTRASEISAEELRAGGLRLRRQATRLRPLWIAVVGVTAYRTAFGESGAAAGDQQRTLGPARLWVLPNPSGLNAHVTPGDLAQAFAELREAVEST